MANFDAEREIITRQLRARLKEMAETIYTDNRPIGGIQACVTGPGHGPERVPKSGWRTFRVHDRWGGFDQTTWFRMQIAIPVSMKGSHVVAVLRPGGESLAYVDGKPRVGLDRNHRELHLTRKAKGGERFDVALESVPSVRFDEYHYFEQADLVVLHPLLRDFWWDCKVVLDVLGHHGMATAATRRLLHLLDGAVKGVDLQHKHDRRYPESVAKAQRTLRKGLKEFALSHDMGTLTLVGQSHIDTAWLWPLRETRRKCGRTFSTVLDLMDRYPDFTFMASQAAQYEWVKEHYPELYRRIKQRVKEGRWEPVGGMYVESDCNVPSGESFVRQLLFGNRFFRKEFGVHTRTAWLPDTFGDSWSLPQILRKAQIDMFVTTKISWSQFTTFPYSFFQWEGPDGSRVPCLMPPLNYNGQIRFPDVVQQWEWFHQKDRVTELPFPFGHGDGGGGPTDDMIETGRRLKNIVGVPRCEFGHLQPSLDRMQEQCPVEDLPVWNGELYLELHRGCQTSQARTKRYNRKCELMLRDAEFLGSLALLEGGKYDRKRLTASWKTVLVSQFHDILPGSSIREVYVQAEADYADAFGQAEAVRDQAIRHLAGKIDTAGAGIPVVVFNTLSWVRDGVAQASVELPRGGFHVVDPRGETVPHQRLGKNEILFEAAGIPPMGYAVYRVLPRRRAAAPLALLEAGPEGMENEYLRIRFDKNGRLASLYDKTAGREVLAKGQRGNVLQLFDDRPGNNDAWDIDYNIDENTWEPDPAESIEVVEAGPLRAAMRIVRRTEKSTITQDVTLYAQGRRVDFVTHVDWHQRKVLLKAAFPVAIRSSRAAYEIQFAAIERATHDNTAFDRARHEVTGHKWADLSEGDYGVSLLNDCKYGYDIKGNVMRLSLLRSPVEPDPKADEGEHRFTYSVYPHSWGWRNGTVREGYELNVPLLACRAPNSRGPLPTVGAFVSADKDHVVIDTVKRCEDGAALVVRLYEAHGQRGNVTLTFGKPPRRVTECDLMEENDRPVSVRGSAVKFSVTPYDLRTFKVVF